MPFYEYQCAACGARHEELQKITDRPLRKCPACGRSTLRRHMSAPVFRLKGGGWYETDFKADKDQQRNLSGDKEPAPEITAADKPKDAKEDAKADAKADAKPAKADDTSGKTAEVKPAEPKPAAAKPRSRAARGRATRRSPARRGPRR